MKSVKPIPRVNEDVHSELCRPSGPLKAHISFNAIYALSLIPDVKITLNSYNKLVI